MHGWVSLWSLASLIPSRSLSLGGPCFGWAICLILHSLAGGVPYPSGYVSESSSFWRSNCALALFVRGLGSGIHYSGDCLHPSCLLTCLTVACIVGVFPCPWFPLALPHALTLGKSPCE